jgi:hypothetical protein
MCRVWNFTDRRFSPVGRKYNSSIRAEDAAISAFRPKPVTARLPVKKILAGVKRDSDFLIL